MLLDKIVIAAIAPLGTSIVLGLFAILFALFGRAARAVVLGLFALLWLGVWSLPVVSHTFLGFLESRYPYIQPAQQESAPMIVVLGGGVDPPSTLSGPPNLNAAADRVLHAARLYHAGRAPRLLVSGGSNRAMSASTEAAEMADLLVQLGVPRAAIIEEPRSRNTRQNAVFSAEVLTRLGIERVLLVTSALHMRRAMGRFEAQGLATVPAAADHEARRYFTAVDWLPSAQALDASGRVFKEIIGYRVGR